MALQGDNQAQFKLLIEENFKGKAESIFAKYSNSFSSDYLDSYSNLDVVADINVIENLNESNPYAVKIYKKHDINENYWQVKLFHYGIPISLSISLPLIENFGVKLIDEHPYKILLQDSALVYLCDFSVEVPAEFQDKINDVELINSLQEAIIKSFKGEVDNDALNKLVLYSELNAREVTMIRAISHYLVQTALPFSRQYIADCLCASFLITHNLYKLFEAKFNIDITNDRGALQESYTQKIIAGLGEVAILDHDRILRAFLQIIQAMLRVNFYQEDANHQPKEYISFKIDSKKLSFLPKPYPLYEIFVFSTKFEAIHLRGGKVARGGLRWSDRKEDFRTEVLGLVKAQIVKNSVIVPTGSKGGFICKKAPPLSNRDQYLNYGVECYKNFIKGLLDITDNLVSGQIIPPHNVIRYDNDDPYLVVAADKGTATFSDYANEISLQYGFWMGDAFASGGSAGYDHKKMGITAKGAWESAKRHFRHLGINIQTTDFTVIGIGDMAGDVFGNGMLLSSHIKLVAAFNHQHIFLDPNPSAEVSFKERERLFKLPRSTWADYDKSKISKGGGVFERSLKEIPLTPEVKELLQINDDYLSPNDLIHAILKAKADMLYNGGIGTYIKSEIETHEMVKDKANDSLRVNGGELQVKVVVEGGNLGATQLGRIEFAKKGGLIYTDAIDNSAGVDCSDHEVNIKILFADIMQTEHIEVSKRNSILESMTNDVASLVLRDNYLQTEILEYSNKRAHELFTININFIEKLEKKGEIDRVVEFLPNHTEVSERINKEIGLTTPELAVLLSYSKLSLKHELLNSEILNDELFVELLVSYFPPHLQQHYIKFIHRHYLKREIIATSLANLIVNRMGITFISRFQDEFRVGLMQIIYAFWAVYKLLNAEKLFLEIEALDNKVAADIQVNMFIRLKKSLERSVRLVLRTIKDTNVIKNLASHYCNDIELLMSKLEDIIPATQYSDVARLEKELGLAMVSKHLAIITARSSYLPQFLDIAIIAQETNRNLIVIAKNYFYIGRELGVDWLRNHLIALPENNKWQALSRSALLADGYSLYKKFILNALANASATDEEFIKTWVQTATDKTAQITAIFDELKAYKIFDLAMLSAVVRELNTILAVS